MHGPPTRNMGQSRSPTHRVAIAIAHGLYTPQHQVRLLNNDVILRLSLKPLVLFFPSGVLHVSVVCWRNTRH